jgi:hypothetical protein
MVRLFDPKVRRSARLVNVLAGADARAQRILDLDRVEVQTLLDQVRCVRDAQRVAETTNLPAQVGEARRLAADLDQVLADVDRVATRAGDPDPMPDFLLEVPLDGPAELAAVSFADQKAAAHRDLGRRELVAAGVIPEGGAD